MASVDRVKTASRARNVRAAALRLLLPLALALLAATVLAGPIEELRTQQQVDLKELENSYHAKVRSNPALIKPDGNIDTEHPDYRQILQDYSAEKSEIQGRYNELDTRGSDLEQIKKRFGSAVKTTGSAPKDVRADVDITARDADTAAQIVRHWREQGDKVRWDKKRGIHINETKDATLWQPPTPAQLEERQKYHDAFSTPGGKQATDVKGDESVRDPVGYVLDNEKKFIHSVEELSATDIDSDDPGQQLKRDMALKTAGKSVSKSADEVGQDSEVARQATRLRNYGDKFEAGITPLGATPEQQRADEQRWVGEADQAVQNTKPAAEQKSAKIRAVREELARGAEKTAKGAIATRPETDPGDSQGRRTAENIRDRNRILDTENAKARAANEAARQKAGLPSAPEPDEREVARQAAQKARPAVGGADDRAASDQATSGEVSKWSGSSKNTQWETTETRDGRTTSTTHTATARNPDGSNTQRDTTTRATRTPGGGRTTDQTRTVTRTDADGASSESRQKTTGYEGRQGGRTSTTTSETDRDAGGQVTRHSDSRVTKTTQTGKSGTQTTRTSEQSKTTQKYQGWMPSGTRGPTTTETSSHKVDKKSDGTRQTTTATTTTETDDYAGRKVTTTTQTDTQRTTTRDVDGRETSTTVTTTTTDKPWQTSRTTTGLYERDLKPGGDPNEPAEGERIGDPTKVNVKIAGGQLFEPVDEAKSTLATGGAGQSDSGGDYGYDAKVQVGQYGATGTWEVTANKRGLHGKVDVNTEVNVVKITATGSAEQKIGSATLGTKVATTAKVGAEGKGTAEVHLGRDRVAGSLEAKAFIGGKAEATAETSLSLWGFKLTGKAQGEVSAGAGAEAKVDAELSWTKIRVGAKIAATLGLGAGGGTSVELDATEYITGYDLVALDRQFKAGDAIARVCRDLRTGRLRLPPGVKFSDIRDALQKKADLYAKHPQTTRDGKPVSLIDSLIAELKLQKGRDSAYITAHHKQRDWYCTNRPQIKAAVALPAIVERQ